MATASRQIIRSQGSRRLTTGPNSGRYIDYYEKITTYVAFITSHAQAIDSAATARTYPVVVPDEHESVFKYVDTAATKSGIVAANDKLEGHKIAIVGVGGTGSYVLDHVAKTPVAEIHIFDGDVFLNHTAFRCPGAASLDDLSKKQKKVHYLHGLYSNMRRMIVPHDCFIDAKNVEQLRGMHFVFICIDKGIAKGLIVDKLEQWNTPFIDTGMGIQLGDDDSLGGILTVTTSTPDRREHFRTRVAVSDGEAPNEYSTNVQISELNCMNAVLAVIKWKKLFGYYDDQTKEHYSTYTIRTNQLLSEEDHEA